MSSDKKQAQSLLRRARGKIWEWIRGLGRQVSSSVFISRLPLYHYLFHFVA